MSARLGLILLVSVLAVGCAKAPPREVNLLLPRIGSQTLALGVGAGNVQVAPSEDGTVHVTVKLERPRGLFGYWTTAAKAKALNNAALMPTLDNNGVRSVKLQLQAGADSADIQEAWTVEVPPIMHLQVDMQAGNLQILGVAGGVDADLRAGKLMVNIPYGALHGNVGTGDIEAQCHVLDYGAVSLSSGVGEAQLTINGSAAGTSQRNGAGQRVDYQGSGKNPVNLSSGAGKVELSLSDH
ncbi:MAG TPA: hypothetical protein VGS99_02265 [Gammaproteobacteria bacterium]|nr:hypothetical protein [Gammaproteobacteria bacterium]